MTSWVELKNIAKANSEINPWWYTQPKYLAQKVKEFKIVPKNILDVGCGDGRFFPGFKEIFPESSFTGIDCFQFQIENAKESFPEGIWYTGYIQKFDLATQYDFLICAGLFNPVNFESWDKQIKVVMVICQKIKELLPKYLLITVDFNTHKVYIHEYLKDKFKIIQTWQVPDEFKGKDQVLTAFIYERI